MDGFGVISLMDKARVEYFRLNLVIRRNTECTHNGVQLVYLMKTMKEILEEIMTFILNILNHK